MIKTLKRPKLQLNIKFTLKNKINFVIKNNHIDTFELNCSISELKNEFINLNDDIEKLETSLLELKNDFGYDEFIELNNDTEDSNQNACYTQDKIVTYTIQPQTQALTIVKTRNTFKY